MARQLRPLGYPRRRGATMPYRKRHTRAATDHHRQALPAVLYLGGVLLLINAWLVSQQLLRF